MKYHEVSKFQVYLFAKFLLDCQNASDEQWRHQKYLRQPSTKLILPPLHRTLSMLAEDEAKGVSLCQPGVRWYDGSIEHGIQKSVGAISTSNHALRSNVPVGIGYHVHPQLYYAFRELIRLLFEGFCMKERP